MPDDDDLAIRLLTLAGAIMEDVSPVAILGGGAEPILQRAAAVREAADAIRRLADAAEVTLRYSL